MLLLEWACMWWQVAAVCMLRAPVRGQHEDVDEGVRRWKGSHIIYGTEKTGVFALLVAFRATSWLLSLAGMCLQHGLSSVPKQLVARGSGAEVQHGRQWHGEGAHAMQNISQRMRPSIRSHWSGVG